MRYRAYSVAYKMSIIGICLYFPEPVCSRNKAERRRKLAAARLARETLHHQVPTEGMPGRPPLDQLEPAPKVPVPVFALLEGPILHFTLNHYTKKT